jgi:hypothetical protein
MSPDENELGFFATWRRDGWQEFAPTLKKAGGKLASAAIGGFVGYFIPTSAKPLASLLGAACAVLLQTAAVLGWKMATAPARVWRHERAARLTAERQLNALSTPALEVRAVEIIDGTNKLVAGDRTLRVPTKFVKVKVRSLSQRTRGCAAEVVRIAQVLKGKTREPAGLDPITLQWSVNHEPELDLVAGVDRYFDILSVGWGQKHVDFSDGIARPIGLSSFFDVGAAVFRFDLVITSHDGPAISTPVFVWWDGQPDTLAASFSLEGLPPQAQAAVDS